MSEREKLAWEFLHAYAVAPYDTPATPLWNDEVQKSRWLNVADVALLDRDRLRAELAAEKERAERLWDELVAVRASNAAPPQPEDDSFPPVVRCQFCEQGGFTLAGLRAHLLGPGHRCQEFDTIAAPPQPQCEHCKGSGIIQTYPWTVTCAKCEGKGTIAAPPPPAESATRAYKELEAKVAEAFEQPTVEKQKWEVLCLIQDCRISPAAVARMVELARKEDDGWIDSDDLLELRRLVLEAFEGKL